MKTGDDWADGWADAVDSSIGMLTNKDGAGFLRNFTGLARRLVTVTVLAMERLIRRLGIHSHRMGPPCIIDGEPIYGCWIEL